MTSQAQKARGNKLGDERHSKVRLNMWLTGRQHSELKSLAQYEGRTVSDIIRQLISIHLRDFPSTDQKGGIDG